MVGATKMQERSIVEVVRDKHHDFNEHIAAVNGERYAPKPNYYHNRETGEDYWSLAGAVAFPALRTPGFVVIVAVIRDGDSEEPVFKVLDEIEESSIDALLKSCARLRYRYGYPHQLEYFYGDPERYMAIVSDFNRRQDRGLYLAHPSDFQAQNRSEIYLERIWSYLKPGPDGKKRLILGKCERLRSHLQNLPKEVQSIEDYPGVAALGYALHSLESMKAWMKSIAAGRYVDSGYEDWERELWGDDDDIDNDGWDLQSTVV
jgi:hypothetical protein